MDLPRSLLTIGAGHSVIALPFATLILLARMSGMDPALEDAAMDLGATYLTTLRTVMLPLIGPALLSAWLTCFIVSFDEVAIALFLAGSDPTFPVFLYGQLRFAQRLPVLIAMAVMLMAGTIALTPDRVPPGATAGMSRRQPDIVDAWRGPTASQAAGLTLAAARRMIAAVERRPTAMQVAMSVAVVDAGDQLVAFARMDGADLVGVRLAQDKAYTALVNRMPTRDLAPLVQPGAEFYGYDSLAAAA